MFYCLTGKLIHIEPKFIVIDCSGVGYKCFTSLSTMTKLPQKGETVTIYTYLHVREDILDLFGFCDQNELNCFKLLISVSGVGPKVALAVLSDLTPEKFALCVASNDEKSLSTVSGIGKKTASRIVLELKDKLGVPDMSLGFSADIANVGNIVGSSAEAVSALVVLGYSQSQAALAIARLDENLSVEDLIKQGLRALAGK